jgi:hypothetical protein
MEPLSRGAARGMIGVSGNGVHDQFSTMLFVAMFGLPLGVALIPTGTDRDAWHRPSFPGLHIIGAIMKSTLRPFDAIEIP